MKALHHDFEYYLQTQFTLHHTKLLIFHTMPPFSLETPSHIQGCSDAYCNLSYCMFYTQCCMATCLCDRCMWAEKIYTEACQSRPAVKPHNFGDKIFREKC
jgi:hypothetical protein